MATTTLSDLAGPLLALGEAIWPHVRRVREERRVGSMPFGGENDLLEKGDLGPPERRTLHDSPVV